MDYFKDILIWKIRGRQPTVDGLRFTSLRIGREDFVPGKCGSSAFYDFPKQ